MQLRKHTTTLLAPLAALAVAGTIGAGPAQANGDEHGQYGGQHESQAAEIQTTEVATATLDEAGVATEAVEPATAEEQEDGTTQLSFPKDEESEKKYDSEVEFLGGVEYSSESGSTTWSEPTVDTSDGLVSFDVAGERTDLLQLVPEDESSDEGDESAKSADSAESDEGEYDLALTTEGADALNEVAGDGAFTEGDVLATTDDGKDC